LVPIARQHGHDRVREQVERVLDGATSAHGAGVECDAELLRQQTSILGRANASLERQAVLSVERQPGSKGLKRALREGLLDRGKFKILSHLPADVEAMSGDDLCVRYAIVVLQQQRNGEHRRRNRRTSVVLTVGADEVLVAEHLVALVGELAVEAELLNGGFSKLLSPR